MAPWILLNLTVPILVTPFLSHTAWTVASCHPRAHPDIFLSQRVSMLCLIFPITGRTGPTGTDYYSEWSSRTLDANSFTEESELNWTRFLNLFKVKGTAWKALTPNKNTDRIFLASSTACTFSRVQETALIFGWIATGVINVPSWDRVHFF